MEGFDGSLAHAHLVVEGVVLVAGRVVEKGLGVLGVSAVAVHGCALGLAGVAH